MSAAGSVKLGRWWTAADQAELDVLVFELVRCYDEHRERHEGCEPMTCPMLGKAIEAVLEWRQAREFLSRAEWLRAERDRLERRAA